MTRHVNDNRESESQGGLEGVRHLSRKIKHGIKWQLITNLSGQAIYFINGIILARILSPKEFGIYGMAQIISNFTFMFWNLGINSAIIQKKNVTEEDLETAFSISFIMGIVSFVIISASAFYLAGFFKEPIVAPLTLLIGTTFLIYAFDRIPSALLGRNLQFKQTSLIGLANPVVYTLVTVPLALLGFGAFSFAWGIIAASLTMMAMRIRYSIKFYQWRPRFKIHKGSVKPLLNFGLFVTFQSLINFTFSNLQRVLTGKYFGAEDLGQFNRAANLSNMPLSKISENVGVVLMPAFSSIQDRKAKIIDWFKKFNFFTYCIISPFLFFCLFFPRETIEGIFGTKWLPAAPLLFWFSLASFFSVSDIFFFSILNGIGKPHTNFYVRLILLFPFIGSVLFSLRWGLNGVVVVLFLNSVLLFICSVFLLQRYKLVTFYDYFLSCFEPILVSGIVGFMMVCIFKNGGIFLCAPELKIILLATIFMLIITPYYLFRWYKKSFITYLNFDLKEVVKL